MRVGIGRSSPADHAGIRDAVAGAIREALSGAANLGVGPGTRAGEPDRRVEGRLGRTVRDVERRNYQVVNVDVTLRSGDPPHRKQVAEMRETLADRMHVSPGHVSVTLDDPAGPSSEAGAGPDAIAVVLIDRIGSVDSIHAALRAGG